MRMHIVILFSLVYTQYHSVFRFQTDLTLSLCLTVFFFLKKSHFKSIVANMGLFVTIFKLKVGGNYENETYPLLPGYFHVLHNALVCIDKVSHGIFISNNSIERLFYTRLTYRQ